MQAQGPAHAPDDTPTPRESALALLTRWHAQRPWARMDPATLDIDEVLPVGPTQVILDSTFERRGVRYELSRASTAPAVQAPGPDPWQVRLEHPLPLRVGSEVTEALPKRLVHMDCGVCSRNGETTCATCEGEGRIRKENQSRPCPRCAGRGHVTCSTCGGSGGLHGAPTVWSVIDRHREVRVVESGELPIDLFLALQSPSATSILVHEQEDERVDGLRRSQGYRDGAMQGPEARLHAVVGALAAAPGVPSADAIRWQRLEVRHAPVFEVRLRNGESVFVHGEPPAVSPHGGLMTLAGKVARAAPMLVALGAALAATVWTLSR